MDSDALGATGREVGAGTAGGRVVLQEPGAEGLSFCLQTQRQSFPDPAQGSRHEGGRETHQRRRLSLGPKKPGWCHFQEPKRNFKYEYGNQPISLLWSCILVMLGSYYK